MNNTPPAFQGWHRLNRRAGWRPVCSAVTASLAWSKLLDLRLASDKAETAGGGAVSSQTPALSPG